MIWLLSLAFGIGGSLLISISFDNSYEREKNADLNTFRNVQRTMYLVGEAGGISSVSESLDILQQMYSKGMINATAVRAYYDDGNFMDSYGSIDDKQKDIEPGTISVYLDDNGKHYFRIAGAVNTGEVSVKLVAYYDITALYDMRSAQYATYQKVFAATVAVGAAVSCAIAYWLTVPLSKLKKATKRLSEGEMDYRADIDTKDEFGELANDFNSMADKLEGNIDELQDSVRRQEEFMGSFAHEMKTPMTSIIGYADLLRSQSLNDDEQMNAANYIFSEGKRLESLSFKLLDLIVMKNGEPDLKAVNPSQLISQLIENLKPVYANQNIILQYKCEDGTCLMDADLIKSLLVNIIDNARKALSNGGNIYVASKKLAEGYEIKVLDNGPGIPEAALAHLTEAFYRVDKSRSRAQGGVGLGLKLCDEIVKMHNGEMKIESRVGNGTCVTVKFNGGVV